jgi:hypothetical protein
MKARHAAVLALLGWYLITAPVSDQGAVIHSDAPLSQWEKVTVGVGGKALSFDTKDECEAKIQQEIIDTQGAASIAAPEDQQMVASALKQLQIARCISSDDPSLKGN